MLEPYLMRQKLDLIRLNAFLNIGNYIDHYGQREALGSAKCLFHIAKSSNDADGVQSVWAHTGQQCVQQCGQ